MAPGFAHGFCVLSDWVDLHYKISGEYNPDDEGGIIWNDKDIGIEWPITNPIISNKDAANSRFRDFQVDADRK
jgi:dTDP-4-dehydrorhamnose 3,5-epimerase